jgi:hypothetical protein
MVIEIAKTFRNGFILTQADLERIVDDVSEQFRQRFGDLPPKLAFNVRLRNGVTVSAYTLDRVLSEENLGDSQIVRLEIDWYAPSVLDPTIVSVVFKNADFDSEAGDTSIGLFVRGEPHEWVSATASLLEQKIGEIRRFTPNQIQKRSMNRFFSLLITPLIALTFLLGIIHPLTKNIDKILWYSYLMVDIWDVGGGENADSDFISPDGFEAANENAVNEVISTLVSHQPFWTVVSAILALDLVLLFFLRYYPFYNFCWGSYFRAFPQRQHARAFVFTVTVWTIVTAFVYSIVANVTGNQS